MIALYLTRTEYLPSREELLRRVLLDVSEDKKDEWRRASEKRVLESLSGILLVQRGLELAGFSCFGAGLRYEPTGRPFLENLEVDFSISHRDGVTACVLMWGNVGRVGVDVEILQGRSQASMERISERWFSDGERKLFRGRPNEMQFLQIWTGKEALSKQSGCGLGGLAACDVTVCQESKLKSYCMDNLVVTLCAPDHTVLPEEVVWIDL